MPANVVWKWKEEQSQHKTSSSISKFSRWEAFDERGHPPPLNAVECGFFLTSRCRLHIRVPAGCAVLRRYKPWRCPYDARAEHLEVFHPLPRVIPVPYEAATPHPILSPPLEGPRLTLLAAFPR